MSTIDSVSVGSYANARAPKMRSEREIASKKLLALFWLNTFLDNLEASSSRRGVYLEHAPKKKVSQHPSSAVVLAARNRILLFCCNLLSEFVLHPCSIWSSPRQQPTSVTCYKINLLTGAVVCVAPWNALHPRSSKRPSHTLHPGKTPKSWNTSPSRKTHSKI